MIADTPFFSRLRQLFSSKAKAGASVLDRANTTRCIVRPSPLPLHLPRSSEPRPLPADHCLEPTSLRRGRERPFTERTVPSSGSVLLHAHNVRPNSFRVQPPPCPVTKPTQGARGSARCDMTLARRSSGDSHARVDGSENLGVMQPHRDGARATGALRSCGPCWSTVNDKGRGKGSEPQVLAYSTARGQGHARLCRHCRRGPVPRRLCPVARR